MLAVLPRVGRASQALRKKRCPESKQPKPGVLAYSEASKLTGWGLRISRLGLCVNLCELSVGGLMMMMDKETKSAAEYALMGLA